MGKVTPVGDQRHDLECFILARLRHNKQQDLIEVFELVTCECFLKNVYRVFVVYKLKNEP